MSLYANTEADVQAALLLLGDGQMVLALRVNGDKFHDQHLRSLHDMRTLNYLELLATSVSPEAVSEFRQEHPNMDILCVAETQNGTQLY